MLSFLAIIIFIFITINHIISLIQTNLFLGHVCGKFNLMVLLSFCLFFPILSLALLIKVLLIKKAIKSFLPQLDATTWNLKAPLREQKTVWNTHFRQWENVKIHNLYLLVVDWIFSLTFFVGSFEICYSFVGFLYVYCLIHQSVVVFCLVFLCKRAGQFFSNIHVSFVLCGRSAV